MPPLKHLFCGRKGSFVVGFTKRNPPIGHICYRIIPFHPLFLQNMGSAIDIFVNSWVGYVNYVWNEITFSTGSPFWYNYFWWLVVISLFFFFLEMVRPWREDQPRFRKDFWLDFFYMFFNYTIFGIIIHVAASDVVVNWFNDGIKWMTGGFDLQASNPIRMWPLWAVLLLGFVVRDFVQWWIHRLLHRVDWLWEFHKVHHSVEQMGFAAHLRFHWMESVVYRTLEYIPLALLGIGLYDFFIIHIFTLAVGHYNHSNVRVHWRVQGATFGMLFGLFLAFIVLGGSANDYQTWIVVIISTLVWSFFLGRYLKYVFNGPSNHIWHHVKDLPKERRYGVNFALSLSLWDYLFGTIYIPRDGRDEQLGFPGLKSFPKTFPEQLVTGIFTHHNPPEETENAEK